MGKLSEMLEVRASQKYWLTVRENIAECSVSGTLYSTYE